MPDVIICSTEDDSPDKVINFGWMTDNQTRIIRKRIFNRSYTESVYNMELKAGVYNTNDAMLKHGTLSVRIWGSKLWNTLYKNVLPIGDFPPRKSLIIDIRLEISPSIDIKKVYYVPLVLRYI